MQELPLVSVVLPCYNDNEVFLKECIESVVNQTYKNIQLIAIDDGSTNGSSVHLAKLQQQYHFTLEKQANTGICGALNKGITKYAQGKYVAILGSDDIWDPNKIALQVQYMESAPENVAACCTRGYYFYENDPTKVGLRLARQLTAQDLTFDNLLIVNRIMQPSVMMRRDVFDKVGLFDVQCKLEDWDMWLRIANQYVIGYVAEPLTHYRRHANNASNSDKMLYAAKKYTLAKWKDKKGYQQSLNSVELAGLNNLARDQKAKALKIFISNPQCAGNWLYWRGFLKIFIPAFFYRK